MPNTANLALPYPALTDAPNVPQHVQNLAGAIDTRLGAAWTAFEFTAAGSVGLSTTATTQANAYKLIGNKTMLIRIQITLTAANGFSGTAPLEFGPLPNGTSASLVNTLNGFIRRSDTSVVLIGGNPSATRVVRMYFANGVVTGAAPLTWAAGDVLRLAGALELG